MFLIYSANYACVDVRDTFCTLRLNVPDLPGKLDVTDVLGERRLEAPNELRE